MYNIKSYTDTKCELEMAKIRLGLLLDRKEKLYCKYFPMTAKLKDVMVDGGDKNNDKMADYLQELNEVDIGTGLSLADEIKYYQNLVNELQNYIDIMNETLDKMAGIEYQLFYEIVYKGVKVTNAVNNIAIDFGKEPQTIWKNYYSKIKKDVKKIACFGYKSHIQG